MLDNTLKDGIEKMVHHQEWQLLWIKTGGIIALCLLSRPFRGGFADYSDDLVEILSYQIPMNREAAEILIMASALDAKNLVKADYKVILRRSLSQ